MKRRARARALPRQKHTARRVVLVGLGRLGGALALGLQAAGWNVAALPHSENAVRRATELGVPLAPQGALRRAHVCMVAVPDAAIQHALESISQDLGAATALVHTSGATPLSIFNGVQPRRATGSFHPLVAVSNPRDAMAGCAVALAATDKALKATLREMAMALQLTPLEIPEAKRAVYHAGAVLAAGLSVALADAALTALTEAGLQRATALQALLPLMRSALRGIEAHGLEGGLTGPVIRGDVRVVQTHLDALPPDIGALYKLLSLRALRLTATLPQATHTALARSLSL